MALQKLSVLNLASDANKHLAVNERNHPDRIVAINDKFQLSQLDIPHDFLKMDIEGYEEVLLGRQT